MTRHVLVPVGESDPSYAAIEHAVSEYPDARITVLEVFDPADYLPSDLNTDDLLGDDEAQRRGDVRLQRVRKRALEQGTQLSGERSSGRVVVVILDFVDEHDVDHVVIGSHGRTGARRLLSGSVADAVASRSPVPVTIVTEE